MSRYRQIHCLIWNDDKFPFLSDDAQLVFIHILTTPFSNSIGCYKITLEALAAEKRWPIQRYRKAFYEVSQKGLVKYDERYQVILIPGFVKYNPPQSPNVLKSWANLWEELPPSPLKTEYYHIVKNFIKHLPKPFNEAFKKAFGSLSEAFQKPFKSLSEGFPYTETETKTETETEDKNTLSDDRVSSTPDEVELTPPPDPPSSSHSVSVPFKKIKDLWNEKVEANLSALPKLVALNPGSSRGKHLRARWREFPDLAIWEQLFEKATRSSFLNGDNDRGFRGTFDWIVKTSINFSKVLEGNYDDEDEMQAYNNAPIKWKDLVEFNDATPEAVARNMLAGDMDIRTVPPDILAKAKKILEEEERKKQQKEEQKKATHSDPPGSQPQKKPKQRREPLEFKRPDKAKDKSNHEPIDLMKELIAPMCEGRRRQLESVYGPYVKTRERRMAACY
ncbi:hypothetical protein JCM12298_10850 [Desulfothermus naphthae]